MARHHPGTQLITIFLTLAAVLPTSAQQKQPEVFKARAELVQVPVIVERQGVTLPGLRREQFTLFVDDKPKAIELFEELDAATPSVERAPLPPHTVRNYANGDSHQDVVILFLDFVNGSFETSFRIRTYLKEVARDLAASNTQAAVLLMSRKEGLVQVHSFTTAPQEFVDNVERWTGKATRTNDIGPSWTSALDTLSGDDAAGMFRRIRNDVQLRAQAAECTNTSNNLVQIAEGFRGIPGRKKLVWMTTGCVDLLPHIGSELNGGNTREMLAQEQATRKAWEALSNANIVLYPVDSNGVANPAWAGSFSAETSGIGRIVKHDQLLKLEPSATGRSTNFMQLLEMAERTGGETCTVQPSVCMRNAVADGKHYYHVGFYLHGELTPGSHKLRVTVNQPDVKVRSREGFIVGTDSIANDSDEVVLNKALRATLDYTGVPLQFRYDEERVGVGEHVVELVLQSPPGGIAIDDGGSIRLDVVPFVTPLGNPEGQAQPEMFNLKLRPDQRKVLEASGYVYRKKITLKDGRWQVRMLLRDKVSGKTGSVSTVIELGGTAANK